MNHINNDKLKLDETTLIEIQDYINELDEKVGLKPETMEDVRKVIDKYITELKNLRLVAVSGETNIIGTKALDLKEPTVIGTKAL
jgi:hypothetical protein